MTPLVLGLLALTTVPDPAELDRLVKQLGAERYAEREAATMRLVLIGEPALESLRKTADNSDVEIRRRARKVVEAFVEREYALLQGTW